MALTRFDLLLRDPKTMATTRIARLMWPEELSGDAQAFIRDNLLAERLGDSSKAAKAIAAGFVPADQRAKFLADRVTYLPEPPEALALAMDLEDFVGDFTVGMHAWRAAPPELELVFEWA